MILTKEQIQRHIDNIRNDDKGEYKVTMLSDFHSDSYWAFEKAIDVLEVYNLVDVANKCFKEFGMTTRIDGSIYLKVIECIYTDKALTDDELIKFYEAQKGLEQYRDAIIHIKLLDCELNWETHFFLNGLDVCETRGLSEDDRTELFDAYTRLLFASKIAYDNIPHIIKETKDLIVGVKKSLVQKREENRRRREEPQTYD